MATRIGARVRTRSALALKGALSSNESEGDAEMPVSEIERMELVGRLSESIGKEAAETLMACVLPDGRDQLATKADLALLRADLAEFRADLAVLRADLEAQGTELRAAIEAQGTELRAAIEAQGTELRAAIAELRSFVESKLARQARLHYGTLVAFLMSVWGVFLAQGFMA